MAKPKAKGSGNNADKRPIGQARTPLDGVPASLREFYKLGHEVNARIRDGSQIKADVAKAIREGGGSVSRAKDASLFAARYTEDDLIRLGKVRTRDGKPLVENHLRHLAMVSDRKMRKALITAIGRHGWTAVELRDEIKRRKGPSTRKGGPKLVRPGSIVDGLRQVEKYTHDWLNHYDRLWTKSEAGWLTIPDDLGDADSLHEQLVAAMKHVGLLAEAAVDLKDRLATEAKRALKLRRAKREGQAGRT